MSALATLAAVLGDAQRTIQWYKDRLGMPTASSFADVLAGFKAPTVAQLERAAGMEKPTKTKLKDGYTEALLTWEEKTKGLVGEESAARRNLRARCIAETLTGLPQEQIYVTKEMQRGIDLEPDARAELELASGLMIMESSFIRHPRLLCGASPDGLIGDDGGVELKCPSMGVHLEYVEMLRAGAMPEEYVAQVQGGMFVTGRKWWIFATYDDRFPEPLRLAWRVFQRDEAFIAELERQVVAFNADVKADIYRLMSWRDPTAGNPVVGMAHDSGETSKGGEPTA